MFSHRRQRFLEAMEPDSVALFLGAREKVRSADTHFPFRQDSDFHYLFGFDHPDARAVLRSGKGPAFTLFVQPRKPEAEIWTGYRPGMEGAIHDYGADEAHPEEEFLSRLPELIAGAPRIYHALGGDPEVDRKLTETCDSLRLRSRLGKDPPRGIDDPRSLIHEMRILKEAAEIDILRRASEITRDAHQEAARLARGGVFEYELEARLSQVFRQRGASGPAYPSIVGGGANATVLHYITNQQKLRDGDLVLVDAGCELEGYASDVTRTYPVGGRLEGVRRDIYEAVLEAQLAALERVRPGATLEEVHDAAVRTLTGAMVDLGLLSGELDDLVSSGAYQRYYTHRTSHWLGLDVHDVGSYTKQGAPRPLEPGMVLTVEPGLYVPQDDEEAPAALRGIGVRIEDDVAVTDQGAEVLTSAIPKAPDEIEAWVLGA